MHDDLSPTVALHAIADARNTAAGGSGRPARTRIPAHIAARLALEVERMNAHAKKLEASRMKPIVQTNPKPQTWQPQPLIVDSKKAEMPAVWFWSLTIGMASGIVALAVLTHGG